MEKAKLIKAQGLVTHKAGVIGGQAAALVLDTTTLYRESHNWGQPNRYRKAPHATACKQDHLGIVEVGYLVLHVNVYDWTIDGRDRAAKAQSFILNHPELTAADLLDENGHVRRDLLPADVQVTLVNNRHLHARPVEMVAAPVATPEPVKAVAVAEGVTLVEDERLVVRVTVAEGTTFPWLRADNAAKAYAKANGNGSKLVRVSSKGSTFVYNWAV